MKLSDFGVRDGVHNARLTREENIFLAILWVDHVGEENAIAANDLAIVYARRRNGFTAGRLEIRRLKYLMKSTESHRKQLDRWKRDVRHMHNHLLYEHDHIPILSRAGTGGGYWIAENQAEHDAFFKSFRKRALTGMRKASRGNKSVMGQMVKQLSFEFEDHRGFRPVRPGSDVSLPVQVVDQFLERMLANPEKFAGDIKRLSKKFGGVLFSTAEVRTLRHKVSELSDLVSGL